MPGTNLRIGVNEDQGVQALALPVASGETSVFKTTGWVRMIELVGVVTTVMQSQQARVKLVFDPDDVAADSDLCTALDLDNDPVGTAYGITGVTTDVMSHREAGIINGMYLAIMLPPGTLHMNNADAANSGVVQWRVRYEPMERFARMTRA